MLLRPRIDAAHISDRTANMCVDGGVTWMEVRKSLREDVLKKGSRWGHQEKGVVDFECSYGEHTRSSSKLNDATC